jgi:hypothetical protein
MITERTFGQPVTINRDHLTRGRQILLEIAKENDIEVDPQTENQSKEQELSLKFLEQGLLPVLKEQRKFPILTVAGQFIKEETADLGINSPLDLVCSSLLVVDQLMVYYTQVPEDSFSQSERDDFKLINEARRIIDRTIDDYL